MGRTEDRRIFFGPAGEKPTLLDIVLSPGRQITYVSPRAFSLAQMRRAGPDPEYATLFLDPPGKRAVFSDFVGDRREEILLALEKGMSRQDELPALNEISDFQLTGPDSSVYAHSMIWNEGGRSPFIQCPELRMSKEQRRIADRIAPNEDHKTSQIAWTVFNETAELALVSNDDGVRIRSLKRQRLSNELKYVRQMRGSVIAATWFLGDEAWDMNDRIKDLKPIDPTG
jgi:hypothetical protein